EPCAFDDKERAKAPSGPSVREAHVRDSNGSRLRGGLAGSPTAPSISERQRDHHVAPVRTSLQEVVWESNPARLSRMVSRIRAGVSTCPARGWQPGHRDRRGMESRAADAIRLPLRAPRPAGQRGGLPPGRGVLLVQPRAYAQSGG